MSVFLYLVVVHENMLFFLTILILVSLINLSTSFIGETNSPSSYLLSSWNSRSAGVENNSLHQLYIVHLILFSCHVMTEFPVYYFLNKNTAPIFVRIIFVLDILKRLQFSRKGSLYLFQIRSLFSKNTI